jgi:hypothetical protein
VTQHPWAKERLYHLWSRGVVPQVPATSLLQAVLGELLVRRAQPLRAGGIVGKEEQQQEGADDGDDAFDDKEPSEAVTDVWSASSSRLCLLSLLFLSGGMGHSPLKPGGAVDVAHPVGNGSSERACQVTKANDAGDPHGSLVVPVPNGDEVDDARELYQAR